MKDLPLSFFPVNFITACLCEVTSFFADFGLANRIHKWFFQSTPQGFVKFFG